ncbi:quinone-dependent dihydroorotate dehydrogenase [Candidatus Woesearchaeota archaeon]|nr:quinone-dependent dihydroorotate dehydrogenase [Candidatus Woesearchaeota archaeon]
MPYKKKPGDAITVVSIYKSLLKPIFFRMDPETVHNRVMRLGKFLGRSKANRALIRSIFYFEHPALNTTVAGITFKNPVGLAAGFDKNAQLYDLLPELGFGFAELGSITGEACAGNAKPRLFRIPQEKSIIVNYGLMNDGCETISNRLQNAIFRIPIGLSIAKTNDPSLDTDAGIRDYIKAYRSLHPLGYYTTINVSCPNTADGQTFGHAQNLRPLLAALANEKHEKPIFIKIKPDFTEKELEEIIKIVNSYDWIAGFIISNLTTCREGLKTPKEELDKLSPKGGLSGLPTQKRSLAAIRFVHQRSPKIIIGCGGIFTGQDVIDKLKAGASLVQLVTALVYEGPGVISKINREILCLLHKENLRSIDQLKKKYHTLKKDGPAL